MLFVSVHLSASILNMFTKRDLKVVPNTEQRSWECHCTMVLLGVLSALSISLRCIDRQYSINSICYEFKYLCVTHTHSHSLQSGVGLRLSPGRHGAPLHWNLAASTTWNMKRHELSTKADRGENKYGLSFGRCYVSVNVTEYRNVTVQLILIT